MLQRLESRPPTLAFRAVGTVLKRDYTDVLVPAVEKALADTGEFRFVYVIGHELEGFTPGALLEDAKLGLTHLMTWKKIAVVTNRRWLGPVVALLGRVVRGEVKAFPLNAEGAALAWASWGRRLSP